MDRMLYVAMSGASETMNAMTAVTNNLANVSTAGFRADMTAARSLPVFGGELPSRVYVAAERPGFDTHPGQVQTTARGLDVAISGEGWLAVQAPDGSEAYTRSGNLRVSDTGLLVTASGDPLLGDGGPITVPDGALTIAPDGTVSLQAADQVAVLGRLRLVNPDLATMTKGADGLFRSTGPAEPDASVRLIPGALESSNVNAAAELVAMIDLARRYEAQVKLMQQAQENDEAATQVLRMG